MVLSLLKENGNSGREKMQKIEMMKIRENNQQALRGLGGFMLSSDILVLIFIISLNSKGQNSTLQIIFLAWEVNRLLYGGKELNRRWSEWILEINREKRVHYCKISFKQTKYTEKVGLWVMNLNQRNDYAHSILSGLWEKI